MKAFIPLAFLLAVSAGAVARPPVTYTGTAGTVDLLASDGSGVDSLLLTGPPGPTSFGIGGSVTTPGMFSGMSGDSSVGLGAFSMLAIVAVLGGSGVGGALSGTVTADIYFTLSRDTFGSFLSGFDVFDPHPLLTFDVDLSGPDAMSEALGSHAFSAGAYHLSVEATFIGVMAPPDTSGHIAGGAIIDFVPMPTAGGLAGAGLLGLAGVRRRR